MMLETGFFAIGVVTRPNDLWLRKATNSIKAHVTAFRRCGLHLSTLVIAANVQSCARTMAELIGFTRRSSAFFYRQHEKPKRQHLCVQWHQLSFTTAKKTDIYGKMTSEEKIILRPQCGELRAGEIVALMGPSGSCPCRLTHIALR